MPDTTRCSWWRGQAALAARWVHNAITQEGGVGEAASEPHRIKFLVALEQDGVLLRDPKSCQSLKKTTPQIDLSADVDIEVDEITVDVEPDVEFCIDPLWLKSTTRSRWTCDSMSPSISKNENAHHSRIHFISSLLA